LLEHDDSDATRLAAVKLVLDYADYKPTERLETHGTVRVEVVYTDPEDGPVQSVSPDRELFRSTRD
jgi:hypothetical protein